MSTNPQTALLAAVELATSRVGPSTDYVLTLADELLDWLIEKDKTDSRPVGFGQ